jgi:hypothetical protein
MPEGNKAACDDDGNEEKQEKREDVRQHALELTY